MGISPFLLLELTIYRPPDPRCFLYKATKFEAEVTRTISMSQCLLFRYDTFFYKFLKVEIKGLHPFLPP